jgi:2-polyprenyl-3-methyl-5-hydroxy-6-metoxy-1,4-benzoquinol methylase
VTDQLDSWFRGGLILVLVELGRRTGVLQAIGRETWRTRALAEAADVHERYLLEWLSAMAAFGVVILQTDDDGEELWSLSPGLVPYLTPDAANTRAPLAATVVGAAHQMARLVEPFRNGGGLSYAERDPNLSAAFEYDARVNYRGRLVSNIIPVVPNLVERLLDGAALADLGCGAAHGLEALARAFPNAHFVGFDADDSVIRAGRQRLYERDITNVQLQTKAIEDLDAAAVYDVVCAFEVIHNLPDPYAALAQARELLVDGGMFFMYETNALSRRATDIELPWAGPIYTASLLSCLTVSLAHDGAGYGAMWGVQTAGGLLADAGFEEIGHREVIDDPVHVVIWASKQIT